MVSTILGRKLGMTQVWDENGNVVPVTVIQAGPCTVSQVKTKETDGYEAVQIGFGDITAKHVNKPMAGHFAKAGVEPMRYLREVRVENASEYHTGDKVTVDSFSDIKAVDVIGTSKGKGFQGTVKRGHRQALELLPWPHDPRLPQPAQARLHRPVRLSRARPQGPAHVRPHGRRPRYGQEPQAGPR